MCERNIYGVPRRDYTTSNFNVYPNANINSLFLYHIESLVICILYFLEGWG